MPYGLFFCGREICKKAFGNFYAPLVSVPEGGCVWTKREPARFRSSNHVLRGFCESCGTPLTYEAPDGMALAIGAFDDPAAIAPTIQFGVEAQLPYTARLSDLPVRSTDADIAANPFLAEIVSHQHPDRPDAEEQERP